VEKGDEGGCRDIWERVTIEGMSGTRLQSPASRSRTWGEGVRLQSPRRRLLGQGNGLLVYLVDGERVRNEIDVDFVNGGNAAVYPSYIPHDEIWIDDAQHPLDRTATALHELVERDLMLHHGRSYDSAHDLANMYERAFRRGLRHHRPLTYNSREVMDAYRSYLCDRQVPKTGRQLDHEIARVLRRRSRLSSYGR